MVRTSPPEMRRGAGVSGHVPLPCAPTRDYVESWDEEEPRFTDSSSTEDTRPGRVPLVNDPRRHRDSVTTSYLYFSDRPTGARVGGRVHRCFLPESDGPRHDLLGVHRWVPVQPHFVYGSNDRTRETPGSPGRHTRWDRPPERTQMSTLDRGRDLSPTRESPTDTSGGVGRTVTQRSASTGHRDDE